MNARILTGLALGLCLAAFPGRVARAQAPAMLPVQGLLTDAQGAVVSGDVEVTFALYEAASGGVALFTETHALQLEHGIFTAYLGAAEVLDLALFAGLSSLHLGVTMAGEAEMTPRIPLGTAPFAAYAQRCDDARTLGGLGPEEFARPGEIGWSDLSGVPMSLADGDDDALGQLSCADGQLPVFASGAWSCGSVSVPTYRAGEGLRLDGDAFGAVVGGGLEVESRGNRIIIAREGVTGVHIDDGAIEDADVALGAAIAPSKIAGTAATLSGSQGFDGNTLRIDAANNRVGINNPSPSVSFDVVGAVEVTGVFRYASPKTYSKVISGAEFFKAQVTNTNVWSRSYNYAGIQQCDSASQCAVDGQASVHLPQGATVTALTCKYRDGANTKLIEDLDFSLVRIHHDTTVTYTMASVTNIWTGPSTTGSFEQTDTSIGNATIDNATYAYVLRVHWDVSWHGLDMQWRGCKIDYRLTTVAP